MVTAFRYTWRTDENGLVWTTRPGEPEKLLSLGLQMAAVMDRVIHVWEPLAAKHEARTVVPKGWTLAMIWRESAGNPSARNPEKVSDPTDDGVGLMQLTLKYFAHGHTAAQLMDPDLNIQIGTDYLASIIKTYGYDFPKVSAAYNAGSVRPSTENPFGMVSTGNHIEAEVGALNYYLARKLPPEVTVPLLHTLSDEEVLAEVYQTSTIALDDTIDPDTRDTEPPDA